MTEDESDLGGVFDENELKDNRETRQCLVKISRRVHSQTAEIPAFHGDSDDDNGY